MPNEQIVVSYIEGTTPVPEKLRVLVDEYNVRRRVVEASKSYPRHVDDEMNKIYDALCVVVR